MIPKHRATEWLQGQVGTSFELAPVGFAPKILSVLLGLVFLLPEGLHASPVLHLLCP